MRDKPLPSNQFLEPKRRIAWKKIIFFSIGGFFLIGVAGVLFVQYDTAAAATFTDNVLRPLIGNTRVIALEKVMFNAKDHINEITQNNKPQDNPLTQSDPSVAQAPPPTVAGGLSTDPISTQASKPLPGEGKWQTVPLTLFPKQLVMEQTFTRPDPDRNYALVSVLKVDMSHFTLNTVAGTKEPGGSVGKPGPGVVPTDVHDSGKLVAAFAGGCQYRDGEYGMIVGKTTYLPLKPNLATIIGHANGKFEIVNYQGQTLAPDVTFVRQNCPSLIENGVIGPEDEKNKQLWGRTLTSDIYTWRSGVGITAEGNLVYAVGSSLTPTTLAVALKSAGAVNAMQLDINPFWVRFNIFNNYHNGAYTSYPLAKGLYNGVENYLNGYEKDFFYLTAK